MHNEVVCSHDQSLLLYSESETRLIRNDIWSLGITLWEVATKGKKPYGEEVKTMEKFKVIRLIEDGKLKVAVPQNIVRDAPFLAKTIDECLQYEPSKRPTAEDILRKVSDELQAVTGEKYTIEIPVATRPEGKEGRGNDKEAPPIQTQIQEGKATADEKMTENLVSQDPSRDTNVYNNESVNGDQRLRDTNIYDDQPPRRTMSRDGESVQRLESIRLATDSSVSHYPPLVDIERANR